MLTMIIVIVMIKLMIVIIMIAMMIIMITMTIMIMTVMMVMMVIVTLIMIMITMIKMIKIVISKNNVIPENVFWKSFISEKPKFFRFMYTNPNMPFLFTAEYCPGMMLLGYNIIVI